MTKESLYLDDDLITIHLGSKPKQKKRQPFQKEMTDVIFKDDNKRPMIRVCYSQMLLGDIKDTAIEYADTPESRMWIENESVSLAKRYTEEFEENNITRKTIESFKVFKKLSPSQKIKLVAGSTVAVGAFSALEAVSYICSVPFFVLINGVVVGAVIWQTAKQVKYKKYRLATECFSEVAQMINEDRLENEQMEAVYGLDRISYLKLKKGVQKKLKR